MKKRFLDRFTYPYLQKRLPENIVPGRGLSPKRVKSLHKGKPLRSPIGGLFPDTGKAPYRSPGLYLRVMKGASRLHKRKLFGEKHPWSGIDTMERGSLSSANPLSSRQSPESSSRQGLEPASMIASRGAQEQNPLSPHAGGSIAKQSAKPSQLRSTEVWIKELSDGRSPGLSGLRGAAPMPQLGGTAFPKEGQDSIYSFFQLEEALSKQQERRPSSLLLRLMERNKLRIMYGNMANREVDKLIRRGLSTRGGLGDNLFRLLESRIDVFLCRVGFFPTIPNARQRIHHGKVLINNKVVTAASRMLKPGDVVSISASNATPLRESLQERSMKLQILKGQGHGAWAATREPPKLDGISKASQVGLMRASPSDAGAASDELRGREGLTGPTGAGALSVHHKVMQPRFTERVQRFDEGVAVQSNAPSTQLPPSFFKLVGGRRPISGKSARIANDARRERLRWFNAKPSNAEISFRCLTAIYLYPPQQVLLPATVDVEKIRRS